MNGWLDLGERGRQRQAKNGFEDCFRTFASFPEMTRNFPIAVFCQWWAHAETRRAGAGYAKSRPGWRRQSKVLNCFGKRVHLLAFRAARSARYVSVGAVCINLRGAVPRRHFRSFQCCLYSLSNDPSKGPAEAAGIASSSLGEPERNSSPAMSRSAGIQTFVTASPPAVEKASRSGRKKGIYGRYETQSTA